MSEHGPPETSKAGKPAFKKIDQPDLIVTQGHDAWLKTP
jgi:hypothetical protein